MKKTLRTTLDRAELPAYLRDALGARCAVPTCQRLLPLVGWTDWLIVSLEPEIASGLVGLTSWIVGCPAHAELVGGRLQQETGVLLQPAWL
jgi:hypothetical protein